MRRSPCEHCGSAVSFEASSCRVCGSLLGYVPTERTIRRLLPVGDGVSYRVDGLSTQQWRCLNASWGCNWVLPAAEGAIWCRSCRLTRGRPDDGRPDAIVAWSLAEASKRRVVHQLDRLRLPIDTPAGDAAGALVFDLVYLPGERGLTGHLDGVVTLDLAEADPVHRDALRRQLGEPFRTLLGSLRHEVGHHYWHHLVVEAGAIASFRAVFGDERADYGEALQRYYAGDAGPWDERCFVTAYARSHPHEDWAETFAHYLHVVDLVDTAADRGLLDVGSPPDDTLPVPVGGSLVDILGLWARIGDAVDDLADTIGSPHLYPIRPSDAVIDKLAHVHACITAGRPDPPTR
jgi:hypothetical protein